MSLGHDRAAVAACSLSRRERGGVRGYKLSIDPNPLTPTLSPAGRGSPAVPRSDSVLSSKVCVTKHRASFSISQLLAFVVVPVLLGAPSLEIGRASCRE